MCMCVYLCVCVYVHVCSVSVCVDSEGVLSDSHGLVELMALSRGPSGKASLSAWCSL